MYNEHQADKRSRRGWEVAGRGESNTDVDVTEDGNHIALQFLIVPDIAACLSFTWKYFVQWEREWKEEGERERKKNEESCGQFEKVQRVVTNEDGSLYLILVQFYVSSLLSSKT